MFETTAYADSWTFVYTCSEGRRHLLQPIRIPSPSVLSTNSLASTPSLDMDHDAPAECARRHSQGGGAPLSPEVDVETSGEQTDGFYVLKKDSQRRRTLTKVLTQDAATIVAAWMRRVADGVKKEQPMVLTTRHLELLMRAFKVSLGEPPNRPSRVIAEAVGRLRAEFDFDAEALMQLQYAITVYQSVVSETLRGHQIKPHWMFALDNLTRSGVAAAINAFEPIEAPKADDVDIDDDGGDERPHTTNDDVVGMLADVRRLLRRVVEAQRVAREEVVEEVVVDRRVGEWLEGVAGVSESAKRVFLAANFTYAHLLADVTKEDLRSAGLAAGTVLTLYAAVVKLRAQNAARV